MLLPTRSLQSGAVELNMEDGDTEKYHVSCVVQDFEFSSRKKGLY